MTFGNENKKLSVQVIKKTWFLFDINVKYITNYDEEMFTDVFTYISCMINKKKINFLGFLTLE